MADIVDSKRRSEIMARIGPRDTVPELVVRKTIHAMGYRFRLYQADLPGRPDIVLSKFRLVLFVHGCYWHRHEGCRNCTLPKTRTAFWEAKFAANVARDRRTQEKLQALGWRVGTIWECETEKPPLLAERLRCLLPQRDPPPKT